MAFGKLYTYPGNPRSTAILAVAKANGLDLELVHTEPAVGVSLDYKKLNKLGLVPTFEGSDGYILTEAIAIAVYITSQNEKTALLGKTKQDYASILRWMSFVNSEVLPHIGGWFRPLIGRDPYNKKSVDDHSKAALAAVHVLEEHFLINTYLVGERLTLADLFAAGIMARGFQFVLDKAWRADNPNVTRWYETVYNSDIYSAVVGKLEWVEQALKNVPPKKENAPKKEAKKEAPKPKPKAEEAEEEEEDKPAPKPKHPLEALPRANFVLDDWKRKYSNEETREVALPWFWENANFEEYSLWKVDYKYNDELTMTFMTSNLIGGFFARLEASRKYIFGAVSVYGETNDSVVQGVFFVRGQDVFPAVDVAPDYESYDFKKLDPSNPEDKAYVEDQWAWDKPVEVNGKTYQWADGKGSGGGPSEENVTGFLVRSTSSDWSKGSVLAVDAGSHLAAITRILEKDFPLVADRCTGATVVPSTITPSDDGNPDRDEYDSLAPSSRTTSPEPTITVLQTGVFAGLPFPYASARANALHVVREHISTYLITHPHLDHVSGFVINTAGFHNTSRPKKLAALPSTVNAIKTYLFNDVIWPNLTDEDGGVGFVTFQRLAEGGNIALGEGHGRGYIEVCDGLSVKGFKVSHGHCMRGPGHVHRGSNADLVETITTEQPQQTHTHDRTTGSSKIDGPVGRSLSWSHQASQPGTPLFSPANGILPGGQCVIDSTAYFIRAESEHLHSSTSSHAPNSKEILIFGDVEPDSLSLSPRTALVWSEAAPKIAQGILNGILIECSYSDEQADAVLFGHLAPRHLIAELSNLADMVRDAKREVEREKAEEEEKRRARKRKRTNTGPVHLNGNGNGTLEDGTTGRLSRSKVRVTSQPPTALALDEVPTPGSEVMRDQFDSPASLTPVRRSSLAVPPLSIDLPLRNVKVVIIHVKDTMVDGPLVGDVILAELKSYEASLVKQGRGLGCDFEVAKSGESYIF
ncbi:hypothetical protein M501DRAFT_926084 [Patellaria atrata CBS 101060]|uniref:EF1G-domain-containing protein n=1 Tax=Patellaria atrata CBS 101060 TaxID=1346257 RepID=A0A9P4SJZ3_9PEZI|nr:hypothetical protein M501DRAFT_926084 [Patellaria atrata CBS 101060]